MKIKAGIAACLAVAAMAPASAQIVVSANDGKQLRPGEGPEKRTPDSISVIDLGHYPPQVVATLAAPASMIGPPEAVAVAHGGGFALVSAAQRLTGEGKIELDDSVSVLDLADPKNPRITQTVHAGPGASGVAINRAGTLALVASTGDDAISIFTIAGKTLTPAGRLQLPAKSRPTDVTFTPDGKSAVVVAQGAGKLLRLAVKGSAVTLAGDLATPGIQPYGAVVGRDGRFVYNTNLGGRVRPADAPPPAAGAARIGTVAATDLKTGAVTSVDVGVIPEHVALSADGRYAVVVVANGSASPPTAPGYNSYGLLQVWRVVGAKLTKVAEAHSGAWCQGAMFSDDSRTVLLQCGLGKTIEVYRFDGKTLKQDQAATLTFDARPGSIASALSR